MEIESHYSLKQGLLIPQYFPRKQAEQLCLIVDTHTQLVYPVPVDLEHIDFATLLLKGKDIRNNPEEAKELVPSNIIIDITNKIVNSITTGNISGMELAFNVRHSTYAIDRAHTRALGFIRDGEIKVSEILKEKKVYEI